MLRLPQAVLLYETTLQGYWKPILEAVCVERRDLQEKEVELLLGRFSSKKYKFPIHRELDHLALREQAE